MSTKTRLLLFAYCWDPDVGIPRSTEEVVFLDAQGANAELLFDVSLPGVSVAQMIEEDRIGELDPMFLHDHLIPPTAGVWAAEFRTGPIPPFIFGEIEWVFLSPPLTDLDQWEVSLRPQRPVVGAVTQGTLCKLCVGAGEVKTSNGIVAPKTTCPDCEGTGLLMEAPEHA